MSRKVSPNAIGGFVLGAIVLIVAGVGYFGGGRFLTKTEKFVLFFDGSLNGLNIGAPVLFKGVKVGSVFDIVVRYHGVHQSIETPVYIELNLDRIEGVGETSNPRAVIRLMVQEGLRANLILQSFVTGLLAIQLDLQPDAPLNLRNDDPHYFELPTVHSKLEELTRTLGDIPVEEMVAELRSTVRGIDDLVRSPDLKKAIRSFDETVVSLGDLARGLNGQVEPLSEGLQETLAAVRNTLGSLDERFGTVETAVVDALREYRELGEHADAELGPLVADFRTTLEDARNALRRGQEALIEAKAVVARDSQLHNVVVAAIEEFTATARAVRALADYLERHPEALLQGKLDGGR